MISPRVRDAVREHFACDTLRGMALEDLDLEGAKLQHWEAAFMGPEVG